MKITCRTCVWIAAFTTVWLQAWNGSQALGDTAEKTSNRNPSPIAAEIDRLIEARLTAAKIAPSPPADDAEFLRRATLDITGRIPTAVRVAAFLNDTSSDRRAKLVDELLAEREYGEHFSTVWYHRMIKVDNENKRLIHQKRKLTRWSGQFLTSG